MRAPQGPEVSVSLNQPSHLVSSVRWPPAWIKWDVFLYSSACSLSLIPIPLLFSLFLSPRSSHISPFSFLLLSFYSIDSSTLYSLALFTHLNLSLLNFLPPYHMSSSFPSWQRAVITSRSLSLLELWYYNVKKNKQKKQKTNWAKLYLD